MLFRSNNLLPIVHSIPRVSSRVFMVCALVTECRKSQPKTCLPSFHPFSIESRVPLLRPVPERQHDLGVLDDQLFLANPGHGLSTVGRVKPGSDASFLRQSSAKRGRPLRACSGDQQHLLTPRTQLVEVFPDTVLVDPGSEPTTAMTGILLPSGTTTLPHGTYVSFQAVQVSTSSSIFRNAGHGFNPSRMMSSPVTSLAGRRTSFGTSARASTQNS